MGIEEKNPGFDSVLLRENHFPWPGIEGLRSSCLGMILLPIDDLVPPKEGLFTPREAARAFQMGAQRLRGFTAARVALKMLARQVGVVEKSRPDWMIETLDSDCVKPCLAASGVHCSASHSSRFVLAVAHEQPIGVDIEMISSRVMKSRHLFLKPREENLIFFSDLGPERTVTRIWTVKEAAAKALGIHLLEAFREVEVILLDENEGVMRYRQKALAAKHAEGNGQVITLINADAV